MTLLTKLTKKIKEKLMEIKVTQNGNLLEK